jgi:hypothetical protein
MTTEELKGKTYEELIELRQDGKITLVQFILAQEDIASYFTNAMKQYGLDMNDENAQTWLDKYEEQAFQDDEGAEEAYFNSLKQ